MISAVLIVKNEQVYIQRCLNSVKDFDEIIVVDTGSTDDTKKKIKDLKLKNLKLFDFEWCDDFAKARNFAKRKATGDYILSIDADEILMSSYEDVKKVVGEEMTYYVTLHATNGSHKTPRLFKNVEEVFWVGAIHETLNILGEKETNIVIHYDYSPAHQQDPERTMRILKKAIEEKPSLIREKYYLAREYWYIKDYDNAKIWFWKYLETAIWLPEIADAYLYLARIYWAINDGDKARRTCLLAFGINPNFKEALNFMAEISFPDEASVWRKFEEIADNSKVLFKRKYGK